MKKTQIQKKLREILNGYLEDVEDVDIFNSSISDLGIDSVTILEIFDEIENEFDVLIEITEGMKADEITPTIFMEMLEAEIEEG